MMPEPADSVGELEADLDSIWQAALTLLEDDGAAMVLEYGSSLRDDSPNDIDLYAVYPGDREASNLELGRADIMRHCRAAIEHYGDRLDPVRYTEPILKGKY